jgi:hypothetical protein
MKTFINWLLIPFLLFMPAWYRSLKEAPKLPVGVKVADEANRTKTAAKAVATEEAVATRGAMSARGLLTGAGLAATIGLLLWPEISDALKKSTHVDTRKAEQDAFERQARAAQDVTASEDEHDEPAPASNRSVSREEDERISAQKDYRDTRSHPHYTDCEWVPIDWEWEEYRCHQHFERPVAYPRHSQRYQYGPSIRGPDGRQHRTRRELPSGVISASSGRGGCRGGCPYYGG